MNRNMGNTCISNSKGSTTSQSVRGGGTGTSRRQVKPPVAVNSPRRTCSSNRKVPENVPLSSEDQSIKDYMDTHGYILTDILGEGSYSKVKMCTRYSKSDGTTMYKLACKIIDKRRASEDFVVKFLPRELQILCQLDHPNVVRVWDIVQIKDHVYIFMDCCDGGDLLEYIKAHGRITENRSRTYFCQLISAVRYLHVKLDVAHRDLKCENVLMTLKDEVKLSDFGFSRFCHNTDGKRILSNTYCGSAAYAAPEILQGTSYNPKLYDMWSLGCILFIMLTGHMPFDESDVPKMLKNQMDRKLSFPPEVDQSLSISAKLLVCHLLEPDVTKRATTDHASSHEWIRLAPCPYPTPPATPTKYGGGGDIKK